MDFNRICFQRWVKKLLCNVVINTKKQFLKPKFNEFEWYLPFYKDDSKYFCM